MTKRLLTALAIICFLVLVFASPHSAQEGRGVSTRTAISPRQTDLRQVISTQEAEAMRGDLMAGFNQLEALLKLFAEYPALRDSFSMVTYDQTIKDLSDERDRIQALSVDDLMRQNQLLPNPKPIRQLATVLEKAMSDSRFLAALEKANKAMLTSNGRAATARMAGAKITYGPDVVAAPSFTKPGCNYDTPNDYASASDLGITNSIIIAESTAIDSLPDSFSVAGFSAPNLIRIGLVIARGVTEEIYNGLEISNGNGTYCESLRMFIEDKMKDTGYVVILAVPYSQGGYLDYVKDSVNAIYNEAIGRGFPVSCAQDRLNEANNFFASGQWLQAYKKYQAAYQNIGASSCVQ